MMKVCRVCNKEKDLSDFHNHKSSHDRKQYHCKECGKEINKKWRKENPDLSAVNDRKKYRANRKVIIEKQKLKYKKESELKRTSLVGKKFNRLIILEIIPNKNGYKAKCICDCGNYSAPKISNLKNNTTKSCGCLQKELASVGNYQRLEQGKSAFNSVYCGYIRGAKERNLSFELTKEEFFDFCVQLCYYCDSEPVSEKKNSTGNFRYNGLDRVDNSIGYIKSNIVTCCIECNIKKGAITLNMVQKIVKFMEK